MKRIIAISLLLLPLTGCGDGEFGRLFVPVVPGGGAAGGGGYSAPAPAQPNMTGTAGVMAMREQHGAVNQSNCYDMERRFRREGRRVRLVEILPNDLGTGGVLNWICIFDDDGSGEADDDYYRPRY